MKENTFSIENNNNIYSKDRRLSKLPSQIEKEQNQQHYYRNKLLNLKNFNEIFELVKVTVNIKFGMHRAGLSLILQTLPTQLGAYHILGSNVIIMNKQILNIIKSKKSILQYNAYLFMVLCHEYLHSFGITDEAKVRVMTYDLCRTMLGDEHPSSLMAYYQPWEVFPELKIYQTNKFENGYEIIKNFDTTTQSYIS